MPPPDPRGLPLGCEPRVLGESWLLGKDAFSLGQEGDGLVEAGILAWTRQGQKQCSPLCGRTSQHLD